MSIGKKLNPLKKLYTYITHLESVKSCEDPRHDTVEVLVGGHQHEITEYPGQSEASSKRHPQHQLVGHTGLLNC